MVALYVFRRFGIQRRHSLPGVVRIGDEKSNDDSALPPRRKLIQPLLQVLFAISIISALALYLIYDIPHYFRDVRTCLQVAGLPYLDHDWTLSSKWGTEYNQCRCTQDTNYFANKYTCWPPRNEPADSCLFVPDFDHWWPTVKADDGRGTCCWQYPRSPNSWEYKILRCNSTLSREANPDGAPTLRSELLGRTAKVACWPSTGGVWMKTDANALDLDFLGVSRMEDTPRGQGIGSGNFTTEEDDFCLMLRKVGASWYRLPTYWPCPGDWRQNMEDIVQPDCTTPWLMGWPEDGGVWLVEESVLVNDTNKSLKGYYLATSMEERSSAIERLGGQFIADPKTHNATRAIASGQTDCDWDREYKQSCRYWQDDDFFCGTYLL